MTIYIDTGIFIDYLISRGHTATFLRTADRRGRTPINLCADAEKCLQKMASSHRGISSSLTYYEVEEALYQALAKAVVGVAHGKAHLIPSARSAMTQVMITTQLFRLEILDVTQQIIEEQIRNIDLQLHGVRAADSLHITTAILHDAEIILSGDSHILNLDGKLKNKSGKVIRCLDSDSAISLL